MISGYLKPLTLYVFICDPPLKGDITWAVASFGDVVEKHIVLPSRRLDLERVATPWYGYIFSNEIVDRTARESLPAYFEQKNWECVVMMKKELNGDELIVTQAPRLFRTDVRLQEGLLIPEGDPKAERMLDGWILDNASLR